MSLKWHTYDKLTPGTVFFLPPCAIPLMLSAFSVISLASPCSWLLLQCELRALGWRAGGAGWMGELDP